MKQPKMSDLKLDLAETERMRKMVRQSKKIRITIHFDSDLLEEVKKIADKNETPYQTLLNRLLREALDKKTINDDRLDRLEKEIKKIKKQLAS